MDKPQIIVAGSIAIDRIMRFSGRYADLIEPAKLHVLSVGVLVDFADIAQGGIGANISHNLASLGDRPILLGVAGPDAKDYVDDLATRGVDASHVLSSDKQTATFNVLNDSVGNQVGGFYPGAMSDSADLTLEPWFGQDIFVWQAAHDPAAMRRLTAECKQNSIRMAYDPGQQTAVLSKEDLLAGIEAAELVIVNEYELGVLSARVNLSAEELKAMVPIFITTHGENGSEIAGHQNPEPIKIERVDADPVVDPTGGGDAYRGGFLYGYLRQWDVRKCGQLGSAVASIAIEQHGPQAKIDPAEVKRRYEATYKEEIKF